MRVRDIMTTELFTLKEGDTLDLVDDIMAWKRIRHIPVVTSKHHLAGLLTHRDLLRATVSRLAGLSREEQRSLYANIRVSDIMQRQVTTTTPDADLRDAAATMIDEKIGCLPVVDGKKLVGIVTEADFLTLAWEAVGKDSLVQKDFTSVRKYAKPKSSSRSPLLR